MNKQEAELEYLYNLRGNLNEFLRYENLSLARRQEIMYKLDNLENKIQLKEKLLEINNDNDTKPKVTSRVLGLVLISYIIILNIIFYILKGVL